MRVLHLPWNIASQISVTVRALRDAGADARGLVLGNAPICDGTALQIHRVFSRRRHPIRATWAALGWSIDVLRAIRWADVIHWHADAALRWGWDLNCAAKLGKPGIVEFWGSDIRMPQTASADNPYVAKMYHDLPELANGAGERSLARQGRFARYGFACLIPGAELLAYIDPCLFPTPYRTRARLLLQEFRPMYPGSYTPRPLVVHAPSHKGKKGTDCVLRVVEQLHRTHAFDFRLLHGVERSEALGIVGRCDVFLDQFVLGAHGLATLEAMALGKPAVCYIKPSLVPAYPPDCPIVNANQDNLADVLKGLLEDGRHRHEIGRRSRAYVEQHHDALQIVRQLVGIYEQLIEKARQRSCRGGR